MVAKDKDSIRVYLEPKTKEEFKISCFDRGLNMSDVASELIEEWVRKNPPIKPEQPQSIAKLVQQNFYQLLTDGKIKQENLKAIASGEMPSNAELSRIAHILDIREEELVSMSERDFPSKRRQPNGQPT